MAYRLDRTAAGRRAARKDLKEAASALGAKLYAEKPDAFARRIAVYLAG